MYELKCPSCGQVLRAAFVRSGAVTDCPRCAHRYRVKDTHIARKVATAGEDGNSSLLPGAKELASMSGARIRVADDGHVIGLSGLSEMMQHEGVGTPRSRPRSTAADEAPPAGRPPRTQQATPRQLKGPGSLYMLASTLCLGLAVVGVALWHASTVTSGGASARLAGLPVIMAVRLTHQSWERPNTVFNRADRTHRSDAGVRLTDTSLGIPANGRPMFTATVTTDRPDIIARARIHLSLVDQADVEVARTQADVAMVARGHPYRLRLPIPADLSGQWLSVASQVEVIETLDEAHFMGEAASIPFSDGHLQGLRITATNDRHDRLSRMLFLITAVDENDQAIMRWRATWNRSIAPGQPIDCQVIIPALPDELVQRWTVQMVGDAAAAEDPIVENPSDQIDEADQPGEAARREAGEEDADNADAFGDAAEPAAAELPDADARQPAEITPLPEP